MIFQWENTLHRIFVQRSYFQSYGVDQSYLNLLRKEALQGRENSLKRSRVFTQSFRFRKISSSFNKIPSAFIISSTMVFILKSFVREILIHGVPSQCQENISKDFSQRRDHAASHQILQVVLMGMKSCFLFSQTLGD